MDTTKNTHRHIAVALIAVSAGLALSSCAPPQAPEAGSVHAEYRDQAERRADLSSSSVYADQAERRANLSSSSVYADQAERRANLSGPSAATDQGVAGEDQSAENAYADQAERRFRASQRQ